MSKAVGRQPVLRCAFCGDDLTAVVAERGKDNPGDCPECGTSIRDSMDVGSGVGWQRRRSIRTYFQLVESSVRRPAETALAFDRTRSVTGLASMHALACGVSLAIVWAPILLISAAARNDVPATGELAREVGFVFVFGLVFAAVAYILNCLCVIAANVISRRAINLPAMRAASVIGMGWTPMTGFLTLAFLPLGMLCGLGGFLFQNFNPIAIFAWMIAAFSGSEIHPQYSLGNRLSLMAMSLAGPFMLWRAIRATLKAREAFLPIAPRGSRA